MRTSIILSYSSDLLHTSFKNMIVNMCRKLSRFIMAALSSSNYFCLRVTPYYQVCILQLPCQDRHTKNTRHGVVVQGAQLNKNVRVASQTQSVENYTHMTIESFDRPHLHHRHTLARTMA